MITVLGKDGWRTNERVSQPRDDSTHVFRYRDRTTSVLDDRSAATAPIEFERDGIFANRDEPSTAAAPDSGAIPVSPSVSAIDVVPS